MMESCHYFKLCLSRWSRWISGLICAMIVVGGCSVLPQTETPQPTHNPLAISTFAAQTVAAVLTSEAPSATPLPSPTKVVTPRPSDTPGIPTANFSPRITITILPTQSATPPYAVGAVCDRAEFVRDVSVPDNTAFPPGATFVKTWRLRNGGTCTWTSNYRVVFESGNALGGVASFNLPAEVPPGGTVDISITLRAPPEPKAYQGNWMLQNAQGVSFGVGLNGDKPFWVRIAVVPPFFAVTGASTVVDNQNVSGTCPHTFNFVASLTTTTAGVVTYRWERSDNKSDTLKTLQFFEPGTQTVTTSWTLGTPGNPGSRTTGWVRLYIDQPNHQAFGQADFILVCTN